MKGRVFRPRRYSEDLEQGGVEIPTIYTFTIRFLINLRLQNLQIKICVHNVMSHFSTSTLSLLKYPQKRSHKWAKILEVRVKLETRALN